MVSLLLHSIYNYVYRFVNRMHRSRPFCARKNCRLVLFLPGTHIGWCCCARRGYCYSCTDCIEREFFIDNLLFRINLITKMILVGRPCAIGI